jgi:hypothetical protein
MKRVRVVVLASVISLISLGPIASQSASGNNMGMNGSYEPTPVVPEWRGLRFGHGQRMFEPNQGGLREYPRVHRRDSSIYFRSSPQEPWSNYGSYDNERARRLLHQLRESGHEGFLRDR